MKRVHQQIAADGLARAWRGLAMTVKVERKEEVATVPSRQAKLRITKSCECCSLEIDGKLAACGSCDAGPFHVECLKHHTCPTFNAAGLMGG